MGHPPCLAQKIQPTCKERLPTSDFVFKVHTFDSAKFPMMPLNYFFLRSWDSMRFMAQACMDFTGRSTLYASSAHGAPSRQPAFDSMTCSSSQGSGRSHVGFSMRHRHVCQPSSPTKEGSRAESWDDGQLYEQPQDSYYNVPARQFYGMMESSFVPAATMLPPASIYPFYAMQMQQAALYQQSYWMAAMQSQQQLFSQVQTYIS